MKNINADSIFEFFNETMQKLIDGSDYTYIKDTKDKLTREVTSLKNAWPYRYDSANWEFINLESKYMRAMYHSLSSYLKTNIKVSDIINIRLGRWERFLKHPGLLLSRDKRKFYSLLKDKNTALKVAALNLGDTEIQYAFTYYKAAQAKEESEFTNIVSNAILLTIEQGDLGTILPFHELLSAVRDMHIEKKAGEPKSINITIQKDRKYDDYLIDYVDQILDYQHDNKNTDIPKYDRGQLNNFWWNNSEVCKQ